MKTIDRITRLSSIPAKFKKEGFRVVVVPFDLGYYYYKGEWMDEAKFNLHTRSLPEECIIIIDDMP